MQGVGFEPTKHYALELESNPFDRSGILATVLYLSFSISPKYWLSFYARGGVRTHEALRIRA
jgi:hypothetical protein